MPVMVSRTSRAEPFLPTLAEKIITPGSAMGYAVPFTSLAMPFPTRALYRRPLGLLVRMSTMASSATLSGSAPATPW